MRLILSALTALLWMTPADAAWRMASSDHFVVYSEADADALREFATRLERFDAVMRLINNLPKVTPPPATRVTVYQVAHRGTVGRLGNGPRNIAGFYIPRARGSIAIVPRRATGGTLGLDAETILFHEYAHHFLFQNFPAAYPGWFGEGFAEFNSTTSFEKDGSIRIGMPANHRAPTIWNSSLMAAMPLTRMIAASYGRMSDDERYAFYAKAWGLTHYLAFAKDRRGQLETYLRNIGNGKSGTDAATVVFGDLSQLNRELDRHLTARRLPIISLKGEAIEIGTISLRDLTPAESAIMAVRIQSDRGVSYEQALELLPDARNAAASYPADPFVQSSLAEAEYDARNYTEAEAAADRALTTDPNWINALIYKGMAKMALLHAREDPDQGAWREVRRWFLAANRVDPDHPEPLIRYYSTFEAAKEAPTRNSILGLYQAFKLAPQDYGLRYQVSRQYLEDGDAEEARAAITPIAFNPHRGAAAEMMTKVLAKLDESGPEAALATWEAEEGALNEQRDSNAR